MNYWGHPVDTNPWLLWKSFDPVIVMTVWFICQEMAIFLSINNKIQNKAIRKEGSTVRFACRQMVKKLLEPYWKQILDEVGLASDENR